jgi:hypothetical protein
MRENIARTSAARDAVTERATRVSDFRAISPLGSAPRRRHTSHYHHNPPITASMTITAM